MTEDDVKTFMLHLLEARKLARSTYLVYHAAIAFLYNDTLRRRDVIAGLPPEVPAPRGSAGADDD